MNNQSGKVIHTLKKIPGGRIRALEELTVIPGVGKSIAIDLLNIGICSVDDLKGKDPLVMFDQSNHFAGQVQDRCLLYVFRCAVYYAENMGLDPDQEKLKWWNWKDIQK
jgi:hypothetical protein